MSKKHQPPATPQSVVPYIDQKLKSIDRHTNKHADSPTDKQIEKEEKYLI